MTSNPNSFSNLNPHSKVLIHSRKDFMQLLEALQKHRNTSLQAALIIMSEKKKKAFLPWQTTSSDLDWLLTLDPKLTCRAASRTAMQGDSRALRSSKISSLVTVVAHSSPLAHLASSDNAAKAPCCKPISMVPMTFKHSTISFCLGSRSGSIYTKKVWITIITQTGIFCYFPSRELKNSNKSICDFTEPNISVFWGFLIFTSDVLSSLSELLLMVACSLTNSRTSEQTVLSPPTTCTCEVKGHWTNSFLFSLYDVKGHETTKI